MYEVWTYTNQICHGVLTFKTYQDAVNYCERLESTARYRCEISKRNPYPYGVSAGRLGLG